MAFFSRLTSAITVSIFYVVAICCFSNASNVHSCSGLCPGYSPSTDTLIEDIPKVVLSSLSLKSNPSENCWPLQQPVCSSSLSSTIPWVLDYFYLKTINLVLEIRQGLVCLFLSVSHSILLFSQAILQP